MILLMKIDKNQRSARRIFYSTYLKKQNLEKIILRRLQVSANFKFSNLHNLPPNGGRESKITSFDSEWYPQIFFKKNDLLTLSLFYHQETIICIRFRNLFVLGFEHIIQKKYTKKLSIGFVFSAFLLSSILIFPLVREVVDFSLFPRFVIRKPCWDRIKFIFIFGRRVVHEDINDFFELPVTEGLRASLGTKSVENIWSQRR